MCLHHASSDRSCFVWEDETVQLRCMRSESGTRYVSQLTANLLHSLHYSKLFLRSGTPSTPPMASVLRIHPQSTVFGLLCLFLCGILFFSLFADPDPTSPYFQFPAFRPYRFPAFHSAFDAQVDRALVNASQALAHVCHGRAEPIYLDPGLTPSQKERYSLLASGPKRIMLVTTTREIELHLPDLLNTFVVLVSFLGAHRLSFSILEGPSDDCTPQALEEVVVPTLLQMGVPQRAITLRTRESKIDWSKHNRIEALANLRNQALAPLYTEKQIDEVVMFNDVFLRASDILEVLYQHRRAGASITAAWDWLKRIPAEYYDVWVGRTVRRCVLNRWVRVTHHRSTLETFSTPWISRGGSLQTICSIIPPCLRSDSKSWNRSKYTPPGTVWLY